MFETIVPLKQFLGRPITIEFMNAMVLSSYRIWFQLFVWFYGPSMEGRNEQR